MNQFTVTFLPDNIQLQVTPGTSIMDAAQKAGIPLKSTCGGAGTCGRCAIKVCQGEVHVNGGRLPARLKEQGYTLACQAVIQGDAVIEIPATSLLSKHQVLLQDKGRLRDGLTDSLDPYPLEAACEVATLHLAEPTLTENTNDTSRLLTALRKEKGVEGELGLAVLRDLPEALRQANWQVDVTLAREKNSIIRVTPAGSTRCFGLAIDLGTTTVVVSLLDLRTGRKIGRNGSYNRQAAYGDDVISRIIHANGNAGRLEELRQAALVTINELIASLLSTYGIEPEEVTAATVAGNTTMIHLFLGVNPRYIRLQPYIPAAAEWPPVTAAEVGLAIN
ncbi:MAG: 2Fe-2S iron-sulfur cluster binding domain-containing protein, partial [Moorella sp. (in: Bacteria)]|nr:2Fe-2S iron-sulfur cluster binding domain-containing protein [Moorella sp. (in: firmicutes)]